MLLPKSDFNGKAKRLKEFHTVTGKNVPGICTQFGSVIFVSSKSGSSQYVRLYTAKGLFFGVMPRNPVNGKVRALKHAAKQIAEITDWDKANEPGVVTKDEAQQLHNQVLQIIREAQA